MFFKNKKPYLKDLIPNNYVDIHSHLLPAIDDGAKSIENSLELITDLKKISFDQFITTPHVMKDVWDNSSNNITKLLDSTKIELHKNNINNAFSAAAEYMMDDSFVDLFKTEKLLTLKDNYALVEMSYISAPLQLYDIIFELQIAGYKPVLAHPERYNFYHFSLDEYDKLKKAGCLFQLNMLATVGYYGIGVAKTADYLLGKGMYDFIGSDVHHSKHIAAINEKIVLKNHKNLNEIFQNNSFFRL